MPRLPHGAIVSLDQINDAIIAFNSMHAGDPGSPEIRPPDRFGYLFTDLQNNSANRLPEAPETVASLIALGVAMQESTPMDDTTLDSAIPSLYTYFGQFIDHDITFEAVTKDIQLADPQLSPLSPEVIAGTVKNLRVPTLDLDSIYGDTHLPLPINPLYVKAPLDPQNPNLLQIGKVTSSTSRPVGKSDDNDIPREHRSNNPEHDRAGLIGDPRNDENVIICQLHVALLHAHNAIVKSSGKTFEEARTLLRQHYQYILIHDFLKRIANPTIVDEVLADPVGLYNPPGDDLFMPLEFSVAAYRFGHSMIRRAYNYNRNFKKGSKARLTQLFRVLGKYDTLPESWIIEWEHFVEGGTNVARQLDTQLVEPLFALQDHSGNVLTNEKRLAVRNLLRGYILRLPTGQAVAQKLGLTPLTAAQLLSVATPNQKTVLGSSGFAERTPLWFYILAEAAFERRKEETPVDYLGPVGSKLVASVLIGLVRKSPASILAPGQSWTPTLASTLPGLLRLAGALN